VISIKVTPPLFDEATIVDGVVPELEELEARRRSPSESYKYPLSIWVSVVFEFEAATPPSQRVRRPLAFDGERHRLGLVRPRHSREGYLRRSGAPIR